MSEPFDPGVERKPDLFRVTWENMREDSVFSFDAPTLDEAIAIAAAHWPATIAVCEKRPGGEVFLLGTWRVIWEGRHFTPPSKR